MVSFVIGTSNAASRRSEGHGSRVDVSGCGCEKYLLGVDDPLRNVCSLFLHPRGCWRAVRKHQFTDNLYMRLPCNMPLKCTLRKTRHLQAPETMQLNTKRWRSNGDNSRRPCQHHDPPQGAITRSRHYLVICRRVIGNAHDTRVAPTVV